MPGKKQLQQRCVRENDGADTGVAEEFMKSIVRERGSLGGAWTVPPVRHHGIHGTDNLTY